MDMSKSHVIKWVLELNSDEDFGIICAEDGSEGEATMTEECLLYEDGKNKDPARTGHGIWWFGVVVVMINVIITFIFITTIIACDGLFP